MPVSARNRVPLLLGILAFFSLATAAFIRPASLPPGVAKFAAAPAADPARDGSAALSYAYDAVFVDTAQYPFSTTPLAVSAGQTLAVAGWAIDSQTMKPARALLAGLDSPRALRPVHDYRLPRPDVAAALHDPDAAASGFHAVIPLAGVRPGPHRIHFALVSANGRVTPLPASIPFVLK